jgi:twitching motility protein PilT
VAQTLFSRADRQGRVAAYEILRNTKAVSNLIRENKIHQIASAMQTGTQNGMILFEKSIDELVRTGKVSAQDARTFLGKDTEMTLAQKPGNTKVG